MTTGQRRVSVDAEPVRRRVRELMGKGMGVHRIARVAGVPLSTVEQLLYGLPSRRVAPTRMINAGAAARLTSVRLSIADGRYVCGLGVQRRLQALVARGWTQRRLAGELGIDSSNIHGLLDGGQVECSTRRTVCALYDRLWDQPPSERTPQERTAAKRARFVAIRRDWAPPMAWDDDTIDDPNGVPEGVLQVVAPTLRPARTGRRTPASTLPVQDPAERTAAA